LGLADATQSADRLRLGERHGLSSLELAVQTDEQVITPQEEGIARVGDMPDSWQSSMRNRGRELWQLLNSATDARRDISQGPCFVLASRKGFGASWQGL
jgi:hypothetical protein